MGFFSEREGEQIKNSTLYIRETLPELNPSQFGELQRKAAIVKSGVELQVVDPKGINSETILHMLPALDGLKGDDFVAAASAALDHAADKQRAFLNHALGKGQDGAEAGLASMDKAALAPLEPSLPSQNPDVGNWLQSEQRPELVPAHHEAPVPLERPTVGQQINQMVGNPAPPPPLPAELGGVQEVATQTITIAKGDTLSAIAAKNLHNGHEPVTAKAVAEEVHRIAEANHIQDVDKIQAGAHLDLSTGHQPALTAQAAAPAPSAPAPQEPAMPAPAAAPADQASDEQTRIGERANKVAAALGLGGVIQIFGDLGLAMHQFAEHKAEVAMGDQGRDVPPQALGAMAKQNVPDARGASRGQQAAVA